MRSALAHVRGLWGAWWPAPAAFFFVYCGTLAAIGDLRWDHAFNAMLVVVFGYWGVRSRRFMIDMIPFVLIGIGYDAVRYPRDAILRADSVTSCGLRNAELALFPAGDGLTWQDFFATHNTVATDLLAAVPYALFVYVAFAYAGYLFFMDRERMRFYLWSLALANYVSFVMWLAFPAAPPWYIRAHGCAVDLAALPNPAALARVDAHLGIGYFHGFYARASSVFGAMPSMHCAFPVLGLLTAWRSITWKTRPLHLVYVFWMAAAAVYLDHHWILDALAGWAVALASVLTVAAVMRWRRRARDARQARPQDRDTTPEAPDPS